MKVEKGIGFKHVFSDFFRDMNLQNFGAGLVAGIFGLSAGAIFLSAGTAGGLGTDFIMIWVTSFYLINGLFGILVPAYYRLPIPMANSIPGALLFVAIIPVVGVGPALGATLIAGFLSFLVGLSGAMKHVMRFTPAPIVMGMIGGVLLKFGLNLVEPFESAIVPAIIMIGAFALTMKFLPKFPAVLGALIAGIIYLLVIGVSFADVEFAIDYPRFVLPEFSLYAFLAYGLPLTIILIGVETPAGVGLVKSGGYKEVPANGITAINGFATMVSAFFTLHSTCIAAPMTGICASRDAGDRDKRWVAAVIVGIIFVSSAVFYSGIIAIFGATPPYFVAIIAGLALAKVLASAIGTAVGGETHQLGGLFAFLIAASGIQLFSIGASFWALVFGIAISLLVETKDFKFGNKMF
ncbi:benzoate/H(+) symporter BenE family transporter [Bacillus sp. V3B]|uniref:benzoate/H(+) symporter BenE family transporter n=1 Tax=Bacillus sp. V3B TaxID=2804915 RepID=UPI00210B5DBB|nr:benzoate/H(+) symporter BenE family transporter [Bacillus sp. V3B]MCQ6275928.1 benzoate/H(+) symporter BenE family transporter [Bacillus sp. V3B]